MAELHKVTIDGVEYDLPSGGLHNYSTEEQVVGTWTNGKPVYEKTYMLSVTINAGAWLDYPIEEVSVMESVVSIYGILYNGATPIPLGGPGVDSANIPATLLLVNKDLKGIAINTSKKISNKTIMVRLQYTKTTD